MLTADKTTLAAELLGDGIDHTRIERNRELIARAQAGDDGAMEALVIENTGCNL